MKGTKSVKTLARKAIKLQEKVIKSIREIQDAECNLDNWIEAHTRLPSEVEEARARAIDDQAVVDAALEQLSKPLDEYQYTSRYYGRDHNGPRRYSSPVAQAAWDATLQAGHSTDRLEILQREAAKPLEEYVKPGCEGLDSAWDTWHEHNTLLGATMARIRFILRRDVIDLSALARDAAKQEDPEPEEGNKMHHVESPYVTAHASELYRAAKAIRITKNQPLPVLAHILVRVTDTGLKLYTRTLDEDKPRTKTVNCWANGSRWETCVPARTFIDWLQVMADDADPLVMDFDPAVQVLQIKAGQSRTEFKCMDAQEFPPC